jgi:hypothetical protein
VRWGVEEHVMCAYAQEWRDGSLVWELNYDGGQHGPSEIVGSGDLPPSYDAISTRLIAEQSAAGGREAGVDYIFNGIEEIVTTVVGYADEAFEESLWQGVEREPLWRRLLFKPRNPVR